MNMLVDSFNSFFKQPISKFFKHAFKDIKFAFKSVVSIFTLKEFKEDQNNHVLERSLQTFELIVKIIVLNVALTEVFNGQHTDLLHDFLIEVSILIIFYLLFLLHYFLSNVFEKMLKSPFLMEIGSRIWTAYVLVYIIILQFTGINDRSITENMKTQIQGELAGEFFLFLILHFTYIFIVLIRNKYLNKRSFLYFVFLAIYIIISFAILGAIETILMDLHIIKH